MLTKFLIPVIIKYVAEGVIKTFRSKQKNNFKKLLTLSRYSDIIKKLSQRQRNEIRPLKTKQSKTNQTCKEVSASAETNNLVNNYSLAIN